jgi:hypothetical protein
MSNCETLPVTGMLEVSSTLQQRRVEKPQTQPRALWPFGSPQVQTFHDDFDSSWSWEVEMLPRQVKVVKHPPLSRITDAERKNTSGHWK